MENFRIDHWRAGRGSSRFRCGVLYHPVNRELTFHGVASSYCHCLKIGRSHPQSFYRALPSLRQHLMIRLSLKMFSDVLFCLHSRPPSSTTCPHILHDSWASCFLPRAITTCHDTQHRSWAQDFLSASATTAYPAFWSPISPFCDFKFGSGLRGKPNFHPQFDHRSPCTEAGGLATHFVQQVTGSVSQPTIATMCRRSGCLLPPHASCTVGFCTTHCSSPRCLRSASHPPRRRRVCRVAQASGALLSIHFRDTVRPSSLEDPSPRRCLPSSLYSLVCAPLLPIPLPFAHCLRNVLLGIPTLDSPPTNALSHRSFGRRPGCSEPVHPECSTRYCNLHCHSRRCSFHHCSSGNGLGASIALTRS